MDSGHLHAHNESDWIVACGAPMADLHHTLRLTFGHDAFRPGQEEVVRSVVAGRPTIAVLPTGAGKSLCYQLPAVATAGTTVVVSPLIALMKDQVDALRRLGVAAAHLTSADPPEDRHLVLSDLRQGRLKLIYVSPERLAQESFRGSLRQVQLALLAVDEAHCVSAWGHDFRPDYRLIREVVQELQPPRLAAFTATATPEVQEELGEALGMDNAALFVRGFHRPDLHLRVERSRGAEERWKLFEQLVEQRPQGAPVLAYATTRRHAEEGAERLRALGLRARHYHAGLEAEERHGVQEAFLGDHLDALVATNAFGMGIDKPDIRLLIHLGLPTSLESYYQEVGRAGRDGCGAEAVLLYQPRDVRTAEYLLTEGNPDGEHSLHVQHALRKLSRLVRYASGGTCRHRTVLEYFGDPDATSLHPGCARCDRCDEQVLGLRQPLSEEHHLIVRKALSGVARTHARFGRGRVAAMLVGAETRQVRDAGLDRLSTYGLLKSQGRAFVLDLLDCLESAGLIQTTGTQYPLLALTELGVAVMKDQDRVDLEWPQLQHGNGSSPPRSRASARSAGSHEADPDEDQELFERLRVWRTQTAHENGKPPYTVFSDRTLHQLATALPVSVEDLALIHGIGPAKLERYGEEILSLLHRAPADQG